MIHAFTTGYVKITKHWVTGKGDGFRRLINTWTDSEFTDWLPIWCYVIEHATGLIVIDTGISENANQAIYFPPYMRLIQRAARFDISCEQEIGHQMRQYGLDPEDVHTVILTHLHQDHDGGIHHFPNARFIVSDVEWQVATGLKGRMAGYLNHRWATFFQPERINYTHGGWNAFPAHYRLYDDLVLVPTPGHSDGHLSVIYQPDDMQYLFIGDTAYTEDALMGSITDGVTQHMDDALTSMQRLRDSLHHNHVILPSHDPQSEQRLQASYSGEALFLT